MSLSSSHPNPNPTTTQPVPLHPRPQNSPLRTSPKAPNPLPTLLQTPSGLALLELQGTINLPSTASPLSSSSIPQGTATTATTTAQTRIPIGRLHFPDYHPDDQPDNNAWMKRVYLYVGEHQRLQGTVQKLPRALAVVRKRARVAEGAGEREGTGGEAGELEVVEVVKWKAVFSQRPEPV
ncbi:hypothetical protein N656DRAFT_725414, partial [Canariomyces notabilis]